MRIISMARTCEVEHVIVEGTPYPEIRFTGVETFSKVVQHSWGPWEEIGTTAYNGTFVRTYRNWL